MKRIFFILWATLLMSNIAAAQDLPKEIRGYKVYKTQINVKNARDATTAPGDSEALVTIGDPGLADVSFTGLTIEIPAEIKAMQQSGRVDFLTFTGFKVNGLKVDIEEYATPFVFKKEQATALPNPARIFLSSDQMVKAAWNEFMDSKDEWRITGRIFVFGKFKKMGFSFKRVVPVDIDLKIRNPLADYGKKVSVS